MEFISGKRHPVWRNMLSSTDGTVSAAHDINNAAPCSNYLDPTVKHREDGDY